MNNKNVSYYNYKQAYKTKNGEIHYSNVIKVYNKKGCKFQEYDNDKELKLLFLFVKNANSNSIEYKLTKAELDNRLIELNTAKFDSLQLKNYYYRRMNLTPTKTCDIKDFNFRWMKYFNQIKPISLKFDC
jgi:hypothetical protein